MNIFKLLFCFVKFRYFYKFPSRTNLINYQEKQIKNHLKFVTNKSQFYSKFKKLSLNKFPIINKQIMMHNFNTLNTVNLNKNEALKIAIDAEKTRKFDQKYKKITVGLSSGTSGHRGLFITSEEDETLWTAAVIAKMLPKKHIFNLKIAFFLRADSNLYENLNLKIIKFKFFDIIKNIEHYVDKLNAYLPQILVAPPSVLLILSRLQQEKKLFLAPLQIISVAEVLEEHDKHLIAKAFNQKIIHQIYQCTEGFLGCTCKYGKLHLNEDIIKIEKEYIDEKRFIPIITDFKRKAQPIIRYRLNDILIESTQKCKCNSNMLCLEAIEGRHDDTFIFISNNSSKVCVFSDFIRRCILFVEDVQNYRVIQTSFNSITVQLDKINDNNKRLIVDEFKKLSQSMNFKMPTINFEYYKNNYMQKMRRIERKFKET